MRKLTRTLHSLPRENDALDSCPGCKTLANTCEQRRGEHVFLFSLSLRDDPARYSGVKGWPQYQNRSSGGKSNEDLLNPSSLSVNVVHVSYATFESRNVDFSVKLRTSISTFLTRMSYIRYFGNLLAPQWDTMSRWMTTMILVKGINVNMYAQLETYLVKEWNGLANIEFH